MTTYDYVDNEHIIDTVKTVDRDFWIDVKFLIIESMSGETYDKEMKFSRLMNEVGNDLVNGKGKIAKRIARIAKQLFSDKIPNSIITTIGNTAYQNTITQGNYKLIIDSDMETYGDFGDSGSCFMSRGCNRHHFDGMSEDGDYYALKIWRNDRSFARCWVYIENDETMLFFNSYGLKMPNMVDLFLQVAPEFINVHSSYRLDVWDNNDGQVLSTNKDHSKRIYAPCDIEGKTVCYHCDETIDEDYSYYSECTGETYCESCYSELFFYCEHCGSDHMYDDTEQVEVARYRHYNEYVCEACAHELGYYKCEHCETWSDEHYVVNDDEVCPDCYDDLCFRCEHCEEDFYNDDGSHVQSEHLDIDGMVCGVCQRNFDTCVQCGEFCEGELCPDCDETWAKQSTIFGEMVTNVIKDNKPECPNCYTALDGGNVLCSDCYNKECYEVSS